MMPRKLIWNLCSLIRGPRRIEDHYPPGEVRIKAGREKRKPRRSTQRHKGHQGTQRRKKELGNRTLSFFFVFLGVLCVFVLNSSALVDAAVVLGVGAPHQPAVV